MQTSALLFLIKFKHKRNFGRSQANAAKKFQVEFVSANPTSSLHVGHGRGAAYGMTVANLLEATGAKVDSRILRE